MVTDLVTGALSAARNRPGRKVSRVATATSHGSKPHPRFDFIFFTSLFRFRYGISIVLGVGTCDSDAPAVELIGATSPVSGAAVLWSGSTIGGGALATTAGAASAEGAFEIAPGARGDGLPGTSAGAGL